MTMLPRVQRVYCDETNDDMREPLLVPRSKARFYLNCGESTIRVMEKLGKLTPMRLTNSATGKVFFRMAQLKALARGE